MFHSVFLSLVDTYLIKVRFPPDEEYNQWHADEKESFRCYRQDIGDSFVTFLKINLLIDIVL